MRKTFCTGLAVLLFAAPAWSAEASKRICFSLGQIGSTEPSKDEKSLLFTLRNGSKWRNDFQGGRCSGLRFEGFTWVLRGTDDICEGQQSLRVFSGNSCLLGKFTQLPKPEPKAN